MYDVYQVFFDQVVMLSYGQIKDDQMIRAFCTGFIQRGHHAGHTKILFSNHRKSQMRKAVFFGFTLNFRSPFVLKIVLRETIGFSKPLFHIYVNVYQL